MCGAAGRVEALHGPFAPAGPRFAVAFILWAYGVRQIEARLFVVLRFSHLLVWNKKRQRRGVKERNLPSVVAVVKPEDPGVYPLPVAGDYSHRTAGRLPRQLCLQFADPFPESFDLGLNSGERCLVSLQISGADRVELHAVLAEHFLLAGQIEIQPGACPFQLRAHGFLRSSPCHVLRLLTSRRCRCWPHCSGAAAAVLQLSSVPFSLAGF